jgi:hypothetical protein
MNADAFDEFNAGTIMGYRGDIWEKIKQYSGLWKSDGRLQNITVWNNKLPGIVVDRQEACKSSLQGSSQALWFNFAVKHEFSAQHAWLFALAFY